MVGSLLKAFAFVFAPGLDIALTWACSHPYREHRASSETESETKQESLASPGSPLPEERGQRQHEEAATMSDRDRSVPGDHPGILEYGGRERAYVVHVPPESAERRALPLVIMLHGGGGNAEIAMRMTGASEKADQEGFLIVYPNGSGLFKERLLTWNAGHCCGYAVKNSIDDVGFIRALIARLEEDYPVDSGRIYAAGMSNGGMMAYRLGCELADQLAGIAVVAGSMGVENCQPVAPLSVLIVHGTADEHVAYEGGKPIKRLDRLEREDKPASYAVDFWVRHDHCKSPPDKTEHGNIVQEVYSGGIQDSEVVLLTVKDGGHAWPGGQKGWTYGDEPTQEISATDVMWEFFQRHPRQKEK